MKPSLNQHANLRTVHVCLYHCAQLSYATQQRTVLIIFPPNLKTVIIAQIRHETTVDVMNVYSQHSLIDIFSTYACGGICYGLLTSISLYVTSGCPIEIAEYDFSFVTPMNDIGEN